MLGGDASEPPSKIDVKINARKHPGTIADPHLPSDSDDIFFPISGIPSVRIFPAEWKLVSKAKFEEETRFPLGRDDKASKLDERVALFGLGWDWESVQ